MPGVKKLHQESENVSKGRIYLWSSVRYHQHSGDTPHTWFCLPLFINLQDGVKTIFRWTSDADQH